MKLLLSLIVIVLLGLHTLPYLVRDHVVIWLRDHGAHEAHFEAININWFDGSIALTKLSATAPDTPPINVGQLDLGIDYKALFEQRVLVKHLAVKEVQTGLYQKQDDLWLGPINLSALSDDKPESPDTTASDEPSAWRFGIQSVAIDSLVWALDIPPYKQSLFIETAELNSLLQWDEQATTALQLKGTLNGSSFDIESEATPLPAQKVSTLSLKLDQFPLESVAAPWVPQLKGTLTTNLFVKVDLADLSGRIEHTGDIKVTGFRWQDEGLSAKDQVLTWAGKGVVDLKEAAPEKITLAGRIQSNDVALKQDGSLDLTLAKLGWQGDIAMAFANGQLKQVKGPQTISLGQLDLTQPGLQLSAKSLTQQGPLTLAFGKQGPQRVTLGTALDVQALSLQQGEMALKLGSVRQQGPLSVTLGESGPQQVTAAIDAALAGLSLSQPALQLKMAGADIRSQTELAWREADLATISANPDIRLKGVDFSQTTGLVVRTDHATLKAQLNEMPPSAPKITAADVVLEELYVSADKAPLTLASLDQLALSNGYYDTKTISADRIRFANLKANYQEGSVPMVEAGSIDIAQFSMAELARLVIESIVINQTTTEVTVTKAQAIKEVERLQAALAALSGPSAASGEDAKSDSNDAGMTVRIGKVSLTDTNLVRFADNSVAPRFQSEASITALNIANIDTGSEQQSQFSAKATINKRASLAVDGKLNLFGGDKNGSWKLALNNMQLPVVSPYAGKFIGYYLQSGQMNFASDVTLKKSELSGTNQIDLRRIEVQPAQNSATGKFNQQLSMPLGTAIAVLEDGDDNIKLDLPVEGSLNDPKFGYQSIVERLAKKGLKQAAFSFLTKSLQPYGALISIAKTAIDASQSGAFINLAPVGFVAGENQPNADAGDYVAKISGMLKERDALRLNVCGNAVLADKQALLPELEKINKKREKPLTAEQLDEIVTDKLQVLAGERGETVMDMLLKQGVPQKQLFSCFAVPNTKNAELAPGVALAL